MILWINGRNEKQIIMNEGMNSTIISQSLQKVKKFFQAIKHANVFSKGYYGMHLKSYKLAGPK